MSHNHCSNNECSCEQHNHEEHSHSCSCEHEHSEESKKETILKIAMSAFFLAAGYITGEIEAVPNFVSLICFGISYIVCGFGIVKEAIEGIIHGDIFNENFLMSIASIGAFAIGEHSEGCMVMLLFNIGEFLQGMALSKSRASIRSMLENKSNTACVERNGKITEVSPEDIKIGETLVVKAGDKIDLDGVITQGNAEVDMSALTGESIPASLGVGDEVLSGSVNLDGTLKIRVTKEYSESTVSKILSMLENAQEKKSHAEHFITRFARVYTPIVCLIALLIIVVPPLFFNGEWKDWLYRGLSALVVSCPCALVISIPLGFFSGLGACSSEGILVKGSNYLEALAKCDTGVFDKTGTITGGKFEFVKCECHNCKCANKKEHRELLRIIAACEKYSTHPIAKSVNLAFGQWADDAVVENAKTYAGMGVSAEVDGVLYYVGNEKLMQKIGADYIPTKEIGTVIYAAEGSRFIGDIVFADIIKEDSKDAIRSMKKLGIKKMIMLTGDKEEIAADISKKAGLSGYYAKLLPQDKLSRLEDIKKDGSRVFYTGDGINDAPVLAGADVGIAMGAIGSDAAIEASDMVIMGDSLTKIPRAIKIARKTMKIIHENIYFSLGIKILILILVALGIFEENAMWLAVFGDVGVCLIAIANSLRALRVSKKD